MHILPAEPTAPQQTSYIGIHTREKNIRLLYVSSGCRQAIGYTPEFLIQQGGAQFIADGFDFNDYAHLYADQATDSDSQEDGASVFMAHLHIAHARGMPILHRIITFKMDNCILYVATTFPEAKYSGQGELTARALDRQMEINVTRKRAAMQMDGKSVYYARNTYQAKAALVLERPDLLEVAQTGQRSSGPLIAFCTGSINRIIEADSEDLASYPFLKLVAPECIVEASEFLEQLNEVTDIVCTTFSLLFRPHIIDGDVVVGDEANQRVVVEILAAASNDGMILLLRKLKVMPPPRKDNLGNYIRAQIDSRDDKDDSSLLELVSTDLETSDADCGWSQLL
ncbi:hypothetical protein LPJ70_005373 [Coemansia sp. RSA 2708]|nr:hypothetical protein LPJ70_005373 [Coemansia sp. RSA 2708]